MLRTLDNRGVTHLPRTGWWGAVIDAPDAPALAAFYARILGWDISKSDADWAALQQPGGTAYLAFQTSPDYVPPVWPAAAGEQQMMMHVDIGVSDLDSAVAMAMEAGARVAEHQPQENVRVMLDPAGHPFCLYLDSE